MKVKICTKCGIEKLLNKENFDTRKDSKSGFRSHCKLCNTKERKKYYENNAEALSEKKKIYNEKNKKHNSERSKEYSKTNHENAIFCKQRRRAKERELIRTLTISQWRSIKIHFNNKCAYCGQEKPLAQEHFIALSKGGEYTNNNIIPSCKICNSSKGNREFGTWYIKQKFYSKIREKNILNFLGYEKGNQQLKIC